MPGGQEAASPPGADRPDQFSAQRQSDPLDDSLSVPGSIIVLPSAPNAWAEGPYATRLGEPIELDGSGSHDRDGRIVAYEWDLDGDGDFDLKTRKPSSTYTYENRSTGRSGFD